MQHNGSAQQNVVVVTSVDNISSFIENGPSNDERTSSCSYKIDPVIQNSESCSSWGTRGLPNFLRPTKTRSLSQPITEHVVSDPQKCFDSGSTEEDEEESTDPETDTGSEDSPWRRTPLDSPDFYFRKHPNNDQFHETIVEFNTATYGCINLQPSDLTYHSEEDDDDDEGRDDDDDICDFFYDNDNVHLLGSIEPFSKWDGSMEFDSCRLKKCGTMEARRKINEDEVALLSERDDVDDRQISYNVDTIETTECQSLEELTLLALRRKAYEGEEEFNPELKAIVFPVIKKCIVRAKVVVPPISDHPGPQWSDDLRRRLAIQKAYQKRLSYGGRNPKKAVKENPHGKLWTLREGIAEDGDTLAEF